MCTGSYYHSCYVRLPSYSLTWNDARDECLKLGGHLVMIDSAGENDYIYNVVSGTLFPVQRRQRYVISGANVVSGTLFPERRQRYAISGTTSS